jgi:hypothetical protein
MGVAEPRVETLLGHEVKGSTGAKVYTHATLRTLAAAIETIQYEGLMLHCYTQQRPSTGSGES